MGTSSLRCRDRRPWSAYIVVDTHSIVSVLDVCRIRRLFWHVAGPYTTLVLVRGPYICYAGRRPLFILLLFLPGYLYMESGRHNRHTALVIRDPPAEDVLYKFDKPWNSPTVTIAIRSFAPGPEVNAELEHIWSLRQEGWQYTITRKPSCR